MATKARIQHKRELEVDWLNSSFVPLEGELIVYLKEVDPSTGVVLKKADGTPRLPSGRTSPYTYDRFKLGDGVTNVNKLEFIGDNFRIMSGASDPDESITSAYYFKYSS